MSTLGEWLLFMAGVGLVIGPLVLWIFEYGIRMDEERRS